jgi:membrane-bound lytic murein transglycosylase D
MMPLLLHRALLGIFVFIPAPSAVCRPQAADPDASAVSRNMKGIGGRAVPQGVETVMRASELRYQEGSSLIKEGDSAAARLAFDEAVDIVLQSDFDLASTPTLEQYFRDLIHRIQRDESRYLRPEEPAPEGPERAVVDDLDMVDLIPIQVDPSLRDVVEADLLDTRYDIPILLNDSVYKSLNFWLSKGRRIFVDGLARSGRYQDMIERIFQEENVPRDLMYLAQVESLFKTNAVSRALAFGIWQFARGTALRYGLKVNRYVDERADPEKSTRAAARYLNDLYAMFSDWNLVLAAYNWGEGAVQRLMEKSGESDFYRLASLKRRMPAETKNHVPMIMASIILARNPEKYGLPTELESPLDFDRVKLRRRVNLKSVAKALDVPYDLLKRLNPALKTAYTPPDDPEFELNVPAGLGSEFDERLAGLSEAELRMDPEFGGRFRVEAGDTLSEIAAVFRVSVEDLQAANNLSSPKALRAGSVIKVPTNRSPARLAQVAHVPPGGARYQIRSGDTLGAIALRYGVTVEALQRANGIRSPKTLQIGTWLVIPAPAKKG